MKIYQPRTIACRWLPQTEKHMISELRKMAITLNAPIATKVVCFSCLLKFFQEASMANSEDPDQTPPMSVLGPHCLLLYLIHR